MGVISSPRNCIKLESVDVWCGAGWGEEGRGGFSFLRNHTNLELIDMCYGAVGGAWGVSSPRNHTKLESIDVCYGGGPGGGGGGGRGREPWEEGGTSCFSAGR